MTPRLTVVDDVGVSATERFLDLGRRAIAAHLSFRVALAGGSTPKALYERLGPEDLPWEAVQLFFGDERVVPIDDPRSNYLMVQQTLLSRITRAHAHFLDDAIAYEKLLVTELGSDCAFDLMLLGMGDDGHTASLFPGSPALAQRERKVVQAPGAAPAPVRLTVTPPVIWKARNVLILVSGDQKARRLKTVFDDPSAYPIGITWQCEGTVEWLVDRSAASLLRESWQP